jgi:uncharacterized protein YgbK (DUF1537 family)
MPILRLLADDLTGALDTAVEFVGLCGPITIGFAEALPSTLAHCFAIDTATRERPADEAAGIVSKLAPLLTEADIAFKKVDSLFRGPWAAELAACFRAGHWRHCILAPAFPHHGRKTRDGAQFLHSGDEWRDVSGDLAATLCAEGLPATRATIGETLPEGIAVFDAETDADLDAVVQMGRATAAPLLWCGTGGLANALARGREVARSRVLKAPVVGLFGSDQVATRAQFEACRPHWIEIGEGGGNAADVRRLMEETGVALVSVALPDDLSRHAAAERIGRAFSSLTADLPMPATLIVAGGETLRGLCCALGAASLEVDGQIASGVPRSKMQAGRWDGIDVISKSGAFGGPMLWRDLLAENNLLDGAKIRGKTT